MLQQTHGRGEAIKPIIYTLYVYEIFYVCCRRLKNVERCRCNWRRTRLNLWVYRKSNINRVMYRILGKLPYSEMQ